MSVTIQNVKRKLFHLAATLSFLLAAFTAVLWMRSYRLNEGYGWNNHRAPRICNSGMVSSHGIFMFYQSNLADHPDGWENLDSPMLAGSVMSTEFPELWTGDVALPKRILRRIGISYGVLSGGNMQFWDAVIVFPDWLLTSIFALLPAIWLAQRYRKLDRRSKGLCQSCGYDLRASPDRCPECGRVPEMLNSLV
jgi:hypothetical protein